MKIAIKHMNEHISNSCKMCILPQLKLKVQNKNKKWEKTSKQFVLFFMHFKKLFSFTKKNGEVWNFFLVSTSRSYHLRRYFVPKKRREDISSG